MQMHSNRKESGFAHVTQAVKMTAWDYWQKDAKILRGAVEHHLLSYYTAGPPVKLPCHSVQNKMEYSLS